MGRVQRFNASGLGGIFGGRKGSLCSEQRSGIVSLAIVSGG